MPTLMAYIIYIGIVTFRIFLTFFAFNATHEEDNSYLHQFQLRASPIIIIGYYLSPKGAGCREPTNIEQTREPPTKTLNQLPGSNLVLLWKQSKVKPQLTESAFCNRAQKLPELLQIDVTDTLFQRTCQLSNQKAFVNVNKTYVYVSNRSLLFKKNDEILN